MEDLFSLEGSPVSQNIDPEKEKLISDIAKLQRLLRDWTDKRANVEKDIATAEASNAMLFKYARNLVQTTGVKGDEKELQAAGLGGSFHRYR